MKVSRTRKWRTLVGIDRVDGVTVYLRFPGWDPHQSVPFQKTIFPETLRSNLGVGQYYTAKVNLGTDNGNDLDPTDFKPAPDPVPEDEL